MALASFSEGKQIDKVKSAALLSPVAYLSHMTTALGVVAARAFVSEVSTKFNHNMSLYTAKLKRDSYSWNFFLTIFWFTMPTDHDNIWSRRI